MEQNEIAKIIRRGWWAARGSLLFVLPLPLILALVISLAQGELSMVLVELSALTLFLSGAVFTKKALAKQAEREVLGLSLVSQGFSYKNLGAGLVMLGTFVTSHLAVGDDVWFSIVLALLCLLGFYFSYELDPLWARRDKNINLGATEYELENTLRDALVKIESIEKASKSFLNEELRLRLKRIVAQAHTILRNIEQSPQDIQRARKFLYVYLDGAKSVCEGYAKTHAKTNSLELEDNFRNVLITIEEVFLQQQQRLLEKEVMDLDVQIEVLSKQLKREGIY